jgi:hypothetical protein
MAHCWQEITITIMKNSVEAAQKTKVELPSDPTTPLLNINTKEIKPVCFKHYCVYYSTIHDDQGIETT